MSMADIFCITHLSCRFTSLVSVLVNIEKLFRRSPRQGTVVWKKRIKHTCIGISNRLHIITRLWYAKSSYVHTFSHIEARGSISLNVCQYRSATYHSHIVTIIHAHFRKKTVLKIIMLNRLDPSFNVKGR